MPRDTSRPKSQWSVPEERLGGIEIAQDRDESFGGAHCLTVGEAERIIENLTEFDLQDVGNKQWLEQHGQIEKLNQQAHASARDKSDEFVLEAFLTFDKLGTLIYDLILIETWRERVYPLLVEHLVGGGENEATRSRAMRTTWKPNRRSALSTARWGLPVNTLIVQRRPWAPRTRRQTLSKARLIERVPPPLVSASSSRVAPPRKFR